LPFQNPADRMRGKEQETVVAFERRPEACGSRVPPRNGDLRQPVGPLAPSTLAATHSYTKLYGNAVFP